MPDLLTQDAECRKQPSDEDCSYSRGTILIAPDPGEYEALVGMQVFVAGATGRLGLRIVRELLLAGFKVRAGARDPAKAQEYAALAGDLGILPADAVKRLQIVTVDLEDEETIGPAIGNAGKVFLWH